MSELIIALPAQLDGTTAGPLRGALLAARGRPVRLDGAAVTRFGALGLQVLLSAARTWRADGQPFDLVEPSPALNQGLRQLGAEATLIADHGAATQ
ncbi:SpoIIAA Anti-anti-sigma regulatory factor (antagonist of anti-sigma factor) [Caulobacteraceae bacterium]|jgi:chemotaxis protein CheX